MRNRDFVLCRGLAIMRTVVPPYNAGKTMELLCRALPMTETHEPWGAWYYPNRKQPESALEFCVNMIACLERAPDHERDHQRTRRSVHRRWLPYRRPY